LKKCKLVLLVFCLVLCFGLAYGAHAENILSPKQMLLIKIKNTDFGAIQKNFQKANGTCVIKVKELGGVMIEMSPKMSAVKNTLAGAELKLDYKLDEQDKKLAANYNIALNHNNIKGGVYFAGDKVILTKDIISLIKVFEPTFQGDKGINLPQYLYIKDEQIPEIWNNGLGSQVQTIPPEFKELLIFIVEDIPDKYFSVSLANQNVKFSINQDGLADVIFSIAQKVAGEKERFADIITGLALTAVPGENRESVRKDILDNLTEIVNSSDYPTSVQELREQMAGVMNLNELTYEVTLLPQGSSKFNMVMNLLREGKKLGNIKGSADWHTADEDITTGKYKFTIAMQGDEMDDFKLDGDISCDFSRSPKKAISKCQINVNVKGLNDTLNALRFAMQVDSQDQAGLQTPIQVPVLTSANSMNLEILMDQPEPNEIKVLIDDTPVYFDVEPQIQNERTMVPLRDVAETLYCNVDWVAPDQIRISRGDTLITMYVNNQMYTMNGVNKQLDAPPFIQDGRTLVPLQFIAKELGCQVDYYGSMRTVVIQSE